MTLLAPTYIRKAKIQIPELLYEWDDWKTPEAEKVPDKWLVAQMGEISDRAGMAFLIGIAEWIYYRLAIVCDDPYPPEYLEGAWAMLIDVRYCGYGVGNWWQDIANENEWTGPIRRVIYRALEGVECAFHQLALESTNPAGQIGLTDSLARTVLPKLDGYNYWKRKIVHRFLDLYPRSKEDLLGEVVPRQSLDYESDFQIRDTEELIKDFLQRLNFNSNSFLSSPDGMLEPDDAGQHFRGTPYKFDIELDRRLRL